MARRRELLLLAGSRLALLLAGILFTASVVVISQGNDVMAVLLGVLGGIAMGAGLLWGGILEDDYPVE